MSELDIRTAGEGIAGGDHDTLTHLSYASSGHTGFAPTVHAHAESDVTNLVTDLAGKVPTARTISTTAPLAGGGDLSGDRTLSMPKATSLVDGYLDKADWTTFNGKANALSGTSGKIAKFTSATAIGDSIITELTGKIGVANSSPATILDIGTDAGIDTSSPLGFGPRVISGSAGARTDAYIHFWSEAIPASVTAYGASRIRSGWELSAGQGWADSYIAFETHSGGVAAWTTDVMIKAGVVKLLHLTTNGFVKTSGGDGSLVVDPLSIVNVPYNAGDFTADGGGSWTVAAGDVGTFQYKIIGDTIWISFVLYNTTVSGATISHLLLKIPAGKTASKDAIAFGMLNNPGGTQALTLFAASGGTVIQIGVWVGFVPTGTNDTFIGGQIVIPF